MAQNQPPADARKPAKWFYLLDSNLFPIPPFQWYFIIVMAFVGVVAFSMVGFLGYPSTNRDSYLLSRPVWILFIWFGLVIVAILWTIFKRVSRSDTDDTRQSDSDVVRWRWSIAVATAIFMALEAVVYATPSLLGNLLNILHLAEPSLGGGRLVWNAINALILLIYVVERLIRLGRWASRERKTKASTAQNAMSDASRSTLQDDQTDADKSIEQRLTRYEVVAHNIFAGAVLCIALSFALRSDVLNTVLRFFPPHFVEPCAVTVAIGVCQNGATAGNPLTLSLLDLIIGCAALVISIFTVGVVPLTRILYITHTNRFAQALGEALLRAGKSLAILLAVFLPDLRIILWPFFIAASTTATGIAARLIQMYLHALSDQRTCVGQSSCKDLQELSFLLSGSDSTKPFLGQSTSVELKLLLLSLAFGMLGIVCTLLAARALLLGRVRGRLWPNWLGYAATMGLLIVCFLWVFSVVLSLVMVVLQSTNISSRSPFPQPGISTIASFVIFVVTLVSFTAWQRYRLGKSWLGRLVSRTFNKSRSN